MCLILNSFMVQPPSLSEASKKANLFDPTCPMKRKSGGGDKPGVKRANSRAFEASSLRDEKPYIGQIVQMFFDST